MTTSGTTSNRRALLLFPTELELRRFEDLGGAPPELATTELCGFGCVAAAARTSQRIAELHPERVFLIGIAGSYDVELHPLGSALAFGRVAVHGIGVGEGASFQGPPRLGFPQWPASPASGAAIDDVLPLALGSAHTIEAQPLLLTTCAASDSSAQARQRRGHFAEAVAEDMEGFAVALACRLAGVPCTIVRGLSNQVGDRDPAHWRIPAALAEARRVTLERLEEL